MYKKSHSSREKTVLVVSYKASRIACSTCLRELLKKKRNKRRNERNTPFSCYIRTDNKWRSITVVVSLRNSVPEKKDSQAESQH